MTALLPLVAPGEPLTDAELTRYSRHVLLPELGEIGQRRLKAARVLVLGAGGLGSPALSYLAAAGVGTIGILDDDVVEESNLQRQVLHGTADLGRPKAHSAAESLTGLNPLATVRIHSERLTEGNAAEIFAGYDLVLDGTDNFPTRYLASDAAAELGMPLLWASVLGFDAQLSLFWSRPNTGAPGLTLRDLFPAPPAPGTVPSCSQAGVVGAMVGQLGSAMAAEAVKLITGLGDSLLGRVLVFDQLRSTWTEIPLRPRRATLPRPAPVPAAAPPPVSDVPFVQEIDPEAFLLDVREDEEVAGGMIPGAVHIPLARVLTERGQAPVPSDRPVLVYCKVHPRAERAALALAATGRQVAVLDGGWSRWSAQHEAERPAGVAS